MWRTKAVMFYFLAPLFILVGCGGGYVSSGSGGPSNGGNGENGSGGNSGPQSGMSIVSISPASIPAGSAETTLTVTGSYLDVVHPGAHMTSTVAVWAANGTQTSLFTHVLSGNELTAVVPAALLTMPVNAQVFIQKWYFADDSPFATSNSLSFTVITAGSTSTAAGSMTVARSGHSATLLPSGLVLVAGGVNNSGTLRSAELFDPTKGTFTPTGELMSPRQGHSATLLPNGKVLLAGGEDDVSPIATAELYDPSSGTFTSAGSMTCVRWSHTATLLTNGKVLLAGGASNSDAQDAAELFDSVSNTFTPVSKMTTPRMHHTETLLANGEVLLAGGWSSYAPITPLDSGELFDPATNSFASVGNMSIPHWFHRSVLLPDGRVLIVGGNQGLFSTSLMEVFDPVTESFAIAGNLHEARHSQTLTLLPNEKVLVTGGIYSFPGLDAPESIVLASSELYLPGPSNADPAVALTSPRVGHTATLLNDGRVLVVGGSDSKGNALATSEILVNGR